MEKQFNNSFLFLSLFIAPIMVLSFIQNGNSQLLKTVPNVDIAKYLGKWHEIASFSQRFQKGCLCTTAEYSLSKKNYIIVENRCNRGNIYGKQSYIKGKTFVMKNSGNAKLKVQFFWPFRGKYCIIDLADDYT